jgi:hypothetical protein
MRAIPFAPRVGEVPSLRTDLHRTGLRAGNLAPLATHAPVTALLDLRSSQWQGLSPTSFTLWLTSAPQTRGPRTTFFLRNFLSPRFRTALKARLRP